jgi:deoxyribodipyrimidine photolyase
MNSSVLWFRHGLRLHDNPALLAAIDNAKVGEEDRVQLFPVFVFDGESASKFDNFFLWIFFNVNNCHVAQQRDMEIL